MEKPMQPAEIATAIAVQGADLRGNFGLIDALQEIRSATVHALWTDQPDELPKNDEESIWWEVWLLVRRDRRATVDSFRALAEQQGFRLLDGVLVFPERTVLLAHGSVQQMKQSMIVLNSIAELRRAKETADFFDALAPEEQSEWLDDLLTRTEYAGAGDQVPRVCILDTGLAAAHPFLAPALGADDLHSVEPDWEPADSHGHGTEMAGIALGGDLREALETSETNVIKHRLESVKLLRTEGDNSGNPEHWG